MSYGEPMPIAGTEPGPTVGRDVDRAIRDLQRGKPVLVHDFDDREGETDLIYPALSVQPHDVARLRNDAGGLICVALSHEVADAFDLPFLADEIDHPAAEASHLGYDERSSFSLPVNHRENHTGITDLDRSVTITRLGAAAARPKTVTFHEEFRTPGHVNVLRAAPKLLEERRGHTELGLALAAEAGRAPAVVVCEMLDDGTGDALGKSAAKSYAMHNDLVYLEGQRIAEYFDAA